MTLWGMGNINSNVSHLQAYQEGLQDYKDGLEMAYYFADVAKGIYFSLSFLFERKIYCVIW